MSDPTPDEPSPARRVLGRYGGGVVAGLGFVITRFFVSEAVIVAGGPLTVAATLVPLVVGLALTVAGVALAVGAFTPAYVADVTAGCLLGTAAMIVALGVTLAATGVGMVSETFEVQLLVANVLLAGAVGGIVNGHRKASLRDRREEIMRGANRARFINRLLRHEVLNAATIVDGHAELLREAAADRDRSVDAIRRGAARIEETVSGIGSIARSTEGGERLRLSALATTVGDREGADVRVALPADADDALIDADERLAAAIDRLIDHAVEVRNADRVDVEAAVERHAVAITVADDGRPLSERQRDVLERGSFPEYDDPSSGFDLQAVTLLVSGYNGSVAVTNGDLTRVTLRLPRADTDAAEATVGVAYPNLRRAVAAGLGAGVVMGGVYWLASGVLPVIGALYSVESAAVGWITHLFHSVVFALTFVAGASTWRLRDRVGGPLRAGAAGVTWGILLWLVAAGVVMPLWLRAVGIPSPLPNLPAVGLVAHVLWGAAVAAGYTTLGGRFE
ncbi:ATP-binding protein [Haloparvum alkalitolerans]|uniref:ATP-binding protein n=1 Tax=Haloparvum alkalitolerans TaxID=1042953 RepID=UPI003CEEFEA6